jgi:hypothetical protein
VYSGARQGFFQFKKKAKIKIGGSIENLELISSLLFGTTNMENK